MHSSEPRRPRIRRWARRLWPTGPGRPVRQIAPPTGPPLGGRDGERRQWCADLRGYDRLAGL